MLDIYKCVWSISGVEGASVGYCVLREAPLPAWGEEDFLGIFDKKLLGNLVRGQIKICFF